MFNGRRDPRSAPFFVSTDFFYVRGGVDRSIHLMHEILVHVDLLLEWDSYNALAAYRLAENNARYGTTSFIFPPYEILNTQLLGSSIDGIKQALVSKESPKVVVIPRDTFPYSNYDEIEDSCEKMIELLKATNLWKI